MLVSAELLPCALIAAAVDVSDEIRSSQAICALVCQNAQLQSREIGSLGSSPGLIFAFPAFVPGDHLADGHAISDCLATRALAIEFRFAAAKPFLCCRSRTECLRFGVRYLTGSLESDLRRVPHGARLASS